MVGLISYGVWVNVIINMVGCGICRVINLD